MVTKHRLSYQPTVDLVSTFTEGGLNANMPFAKGIVFVHSSNGLKDEIFRPSFEWGNDPVGAQQSHRIQPKMLYMTCSHLYDKVLDQPDWFQMSMPQEAAFSRRIIEKLPYAAVAVPMRRVRPARHSHVKSFAKGLNSVVPSKQVIKMAQTLVEAALHRTIEPDIGVDVDGALSFDLRTSQGYLVIAELSLSGNLHVSVYDDSGGSLDSKARIPQADVTDLVGWL